MNQIHYENNTILRSPLTKRKQVRNHLCAAQLDELHEIKGRNFEGRGRCTRQRSHSRIDGRRLEERLPTKHLVWETPISVEPSVTAPLDFRQRNKETRHCPIIVCTIAAVKLAQRSLFGRQRFASGAETERGVQTYSMSDNKVSPSQEGCWLSSGVQRIETKVTILWLWEGHESGGQTGTTFATWPIYITAKACLVAKLARGSINRMG